MLRLHIAAVVIISAMIGWAPSVHGQAPRVLELSFAPDGLVTLSAQNVTVRDILAEWARQCGCFVVNADRLAGAPLPVPLAFSKVPQDQVLRSLLRETGGFALTPRRAGSTSVSLYETIYIINPTAPAAPASAFGAPSPTFTPITAVRTAPDDEIPPVVPLIVTTDPAAGSPAGEPQEAQASETPRPPAMGGFTITPVTPVTAVPVVPATPAPSGQPGRVTPGPNQP